MEANVNLKNLLSILLFLSITSCQINDQTPSQNKDEKGPQTIKNSDTIQIHIDSASIKTEAAPIVDSILSFITDDYPITNEIISKIGDQSDNFKLTSGSTISIEQCWFKHSNQSLIIQLATDYYRYYTYHFNNQDIPNDILYNIGFHTESGQLAEDKNVKKDFNGFLKQSSIIDSKYFQSNLGFKLGSTKKDAIDQYGEPDSVKINDSIEKIEWHFTGEYNFDKTADLKGKSLAKECWGYSVLMYFRKKKLIGHVIIKEIP
jgi:hypothetical protein